MQQSRKRMIFFSKISGFFCWNLFQGIWATPFAKKTNENSSIWDQKFCFFVGGSACTIRGLPEEEGEQKPGAARLLFPFFQNCPVTE